ncbi:STK31 kinase, partial [Glaucidium brasilianum]|nr:STK31 kinase [Glaucidium brasilianum]
NVSRSEDLLKITRVLAEVCPRANALSSKPDLTKIYGGCFSEDGCWYRCVVQQCQVLYIDYGNSEILDTSGIVEIPSNLRCPSVAKKYRLWGLQIPNNQDLNMFEEGKKFLISLVFEKEIKIYHKAKHEDGTIIARAELEEMDIGQEVARAGFAKKCTSAGNTSNMEKKKVCPTQHRHQETKVSVPVWMNRYDQVLNSTLRGRFDRAAASTRSQNFTGNRMFASKEKIPAFTSASDTSLAQVRLDQKLSREKQVLRRENVNLLQRQKELELTVQQLKCGLQELNYGLQQEEASMKSSESFEETICTQFEMIVRSLAAKVKSLKEIRYVEAKNSFVDHLSQAIEVVTEGCLTVPCSLEKLQKIWTEYDLAQERIQLCRNVDEGHELIIKRDEVQENLCSAVKEFILEVDQLPLSERSRTLQELSASLETVYGQVSEADDSKEAFQQFFNYKNAKMKKLIGVRNDTETALQILADWFRGILKCFDLMSEASSNSAEVVGSADEIFKKVKLAICEELNTDLNEHDEAEKGIIMSAYNKVMHKVNQEQNMITVIQNKYLASIEFKKLAEEWLNRKPDIKNLLSIKETVKSLKSHLRQKLLEKNNFEEQSDCSEFEMKRIKEEIADLQNKVLQEISKEQEEYEKLAYLVQKWLPELPLLYPELGILNYMSSGGLLACSLERDLLDGEPMKELSMKRPLVCLEIQGRKVLLKGYSICVSSEARVIEGLGKYHRAWNQQKEKSGLLQPDPLMYVMVPYYPGESLGALQADTPLTLEEALRVMKGVAQGLQTLHGANIVHGSLHENNVFAVNRKRGVLADFDFTKSEKERAAANTMVAGTLSLVSPELKMGQPASPASDMYAYGCLLFWVC